MFSAVPRASGPVFMFSAPELVFGVTIGVRSRFHVLRGQTRFQWYRWRQIPFSCYALPKSYSAVPGASCPVYLFCAPGLIFDDTEGVRSRFHVLRSRTCFRLYRVRLILFSCFLLLDMFSAVPRASGPVFMFCAAKLVFGGTGGVVSRFIVLRARTRLRRYRRRRVWFSCFSLPGSFSAVKGASGPVFLFCACATLFYEVRNAAWGAMGCGRRTRRSLLSVHFPLLDMFSAVPRASVPVFIFYAPEFIFDGTGGVIFPFIILRTWTRLRRYRRRRVPVYP
jgi:hypothetical protein